MSKIIEALRVRSSSVPDEGSPAPAKEIVIEKSAHELTQEQLADIYFSATGKPKTAEPPVIIKIIERPRLASWIPWGIAILAFLITAGSLFSSKRIWIDVRVMDEDSAFIRSLKSQRAEELKEVEIGRSGANNPLNAQKIAVQDFTFEGAAYLYSSKDKNGGLTLINSSVAPFARAVLNADPPLDLSGSRIIFYVKGGRGGENVAFAIKDQDNRQGFYKGKIYPFPDRLTTSWQKAEVLMGEETAKDFDTAHVVSLRFEFGSKDTGNKPNDTIFIKDLQWVRS